MDCVDLAGLRLPCLDRTALSPCAGFDGAEALQLLDFAAVATVLKLALRDAIPPINAQPFRPGVSLVAPVLQVRGQPVADAVDDGPQLAGLRGKRLERNPAVDRNAELAGVYVGKVVGKQGKLRRVGIALSRGRWRVTQAQCRNQFQDSRRYLPLPALLGRRRAWREAGRA